MELCSAASRDGRQSLRPLRIDVVSIQSQVVYGCVGNNVAVPVLQAQGLGVAAVPTVLLSNTPHYPTIHGGAVPIAWFEGYLRDLFERDAMAEARAILAGYLGSPEQAHVLGSWIGQALEMHPALRIVVDPVLGDHDHGEYVSPGMAEAYRRYLLPLADGLTPNGFELARLTGMPVNTVEGVVTAARSLLTERTEWIAVTSAAPNACAADELQVVLVTRTTAEVIRHPRIDTTPKGTGDLFCATLAGQWLNGIGLPQATVQACQEVVRALHRTRQEHCAELLVPPMGSRENAPSAQANAQVRQFTYQLEIKESPCHPPTPT